MSLHEFLTDNYELSKFVLPAKHPDNDELDEKEMALLMEYINDKDFYEINHIIRNRYKKG